MAASELVRTPAELPFASYDRSRIDGSVNETGKLTAHFSDVARGDSELGLRYAIRQVSNNRWKNLFEMMLGSHGNEGRRNHEPQRR